VREKDGQTQGAGPGLQLNQRKGAGQTQGQGPGQQQKLGQGAGQAQEQGSGQRQKQHQGAEQTQGQGPEHQEKQGQGPGQTQVHCEEKGGEDANRNSVIEGRTWRRGRGKGRGGMRGRGRGGNERSGASTNLTVVGETPANVISNGGMSNVVDLGAAASGSAVEPVLSGVFRVETDEEIDEFLSKFSPRFKYGKQMNELLQKDCRDVLHWAMESEDDDVKAFTHRTLFAKDFKFPQKRTMFTSRKQLWRDVRADTGLDIPWSTFCRWTKSIRKPRTRSDLCPVCARGSYLLNAQRVCERRGEHLTGKNAEALEAYRQHVIGNEVQREGLRKAIERLQPGRAVILTDFKEDWALPLCLCGIQVDFFSPNQVAHLAFVVITRKDLTTVQYEYYHFLQNPPKKDAVMVGECLLDLRDVPSVKDAKILDFFADCGAHFLNRCVLYHLLSPQSPLVGHTVSITFFTEHHGKSVCDSAFGYLTRAVFCNLTEDRIITLPQFMQYLEELRNDEREEGGHSQIGKNNHFIQFLSFFFFFFLVFLFLLLF
jgi:hypothetical protein